MTKAEFEKLIEDLLDSGLEITLSKDEGQIWYNLNTGMKSHLYITLRDDTCVWSGRYGARGGDRGHRRCA